MTRYIKIPDNAVRGEIVSGMQTWEVPDSPHDVWDIMHDLDIEVIEDLPVTNQQYEFLIRTNEGDVRIPIEANWIMRERASSTPPPEPEPEPEVTTFRVVVSKLNVRSTPEKLSTNDVGDIFQDEQFTVIEPVIEGARYQWVQIHEHARYPGRYVAIWDKDTSTPLCVYVTEPEEPEPEPEPEPTTGRVSVAQMPNGYYGLSVDGRTPAFSVGARLDRLWIFKDQNIHAAGMADLDYWGNPAVDENGFYMFPGDKTLGKITDIQSKIQNEPPHNRGNPAFVSYFSAFAHPDMTHAKMLQYNKTMAQWCTAWNLMFMPIGEDAFGVGAHLWANNDYHPPENWGQFDDDFWLDEAWNGPYADWMIYLLNGLKSEPNLGGFVLFNEAQINEDPAGTFPAFKYAIKSLVEIGKGIVDVPFLIDIINIDHVHGPGATAAMAEELYRDTGIDGISGHYYQFDDGRPVDDEWEFEKSWIGGIAKANQKFAIVSEWGQDPKRPTPDQRESVKQFFNRQYQRGVWAAHPWAFDFRSFDINVGSGPMTSYGNPAFFDIVDMMASNEWR